MTIYKKPRSEVFASNAPESEVSTFTAWLRGLGIAFDETNGLPEFSGLNNVFNLLNQYIKYLEQNGFAEWSPDLEYPIGAGVRVGAVWYRAKTQNISKPPATSQNDWELFLNASALTYENPLYIENNVVKVYGATQTQSGVVQFANDTEVAQKANVSKVVNPAQSFSLGFGVGQSWQNLTSSRVSGQTYTNNTGKPIQIIFAIKDTFGVGFSLVLNGVSIFNLNYDIPPDMFYPLSFTVPAGHTYSISWGGNKSSALLTWSELR